MNGAVAGAHLPPPLFVTLCAPQPQQIGERYGVFSKLTAFGIPSTVPLLSSRCATSIAFLLGKFTTTKPLSRFVLVRSTAAAGSREAGSPTRDAAALLRTSTVGPMVT